MPIVVFDREDYSYSVFNSIAGKRYYNKLYKTLAGQDIDDQMKKLFRLIFTLTPFLLMIHILFPYFQFLEMLGQAV